MTVQVERLGVLVAFVASVAVANWMVDNIGPVPVGFGLMAPAGVFVAGAAFTIRDSLHELGGIRWVAAGIILGAALSWSVSSGDLAVASAVAFGVSETTDLIVYTPLRERAWLAALVLSNVVGTIVDSVIFLWLAFGSLEFLKGQVVGKWWATGFAVAAVVGFRRRSLWTSG